MFGFGKKKTTKRYAGSGTSPSRSSDYDNTASIVAATSFTDYGSGNDYSAPSCSYSDSSSSSSSDGGCSVSSD
jgi:hypothetical protein